MRQPAFLHALNGSKFARSTYFSWHLSHAAKETGHDCEFMEGVKPLKLCKVAASPSSISLSRIRGFCIKNGVATHAWEGAEGRTQSEEKGKNGVTFASKMALAHGAAFFKGWHYFAKFEGLCESAGHTKCSFSSYCDTRCSGDDACLLFESGLELMQVAVACLSLSQDLHEKIPTHVDAHVFCSDDVCISGHFISLVIFLSAQAVVHVMKHFYF